MHRARRILLLVDAGRRLGPSWCAFRLRYLVRRRSGRLRRATETTCWPDVSTHTRWPAVVDSTALRAELNASVDDDRLTELRRTRDLLASFTFDVFGTDVPMDSWHHDPSTDFHYDHSAHWTDVSTPASSDVKRVWEPSRFTWAFDLARLHLIDPSSGASDIYWQLLDDWMRHNPPNAGVNWGCGQEASFRLLSVIAAADAMEDSATDDRNRLVRQLAVATGRRVEANIDYARSQANNHHASEAMGLITCGLLFADEPDAAMWLRLGERHLREVCEVLVFADGGTSQYSTNYHRVFLHDLVWVAQVNRAADRAVPTWLQGAGERATGFLDAITEPISGSGPFFGPDDGARVLPLSGAPHRQLRDDVLLAGAVFGVDVSTPHFARCESVSWFGLEQPQGPAAGPTRGEQFVESYPDMGAHVLVSGSTRVYVRATEWRFRPAHDDQLHCDVWIGGANVVRDAATATYHPQPGEPGPLSSADVHNGPRLVDAAGMVKASKFLWAKWTNARVVALDASADEAIGTFAHTVGGIEMVRTVVVGDSVTITDTASGAMQASWLIDRDHITRVIFDGPVDERAGFASAQYGTSYPVTYRIVASHRAGGVDRIETVIG